VNSFAMKYFEDTLLQHYVASLECQRTHSVKNSETPEQYSSVEFSIDKMVTQPLLKKYINGMILEVN